MHQKKKEKEIVYILLRFFNVKAKKWTFDNYVFIYWLKFDYNQSNAIVPKQVYSKNI